MKEQAPELCKHSDPSQCSTECAEKARIFDEWLRNKLKEENMAKPFPSKLYVVRVGEGADEFYSAETSILPLAEKGETIPMAVYELAGEGKVTLSEPAVEMKPRPKLKRVK